MNEKECPICHNLTHEDIPRPDVPCPDCGGSGYKGDCNGCSVINKRTKGEHCDDHCTCPHCNGTGRRGVEWGRDREIGGQSPDGSWPTALDYHPLHLLDLQDGDVAGAYADFVRAAEYSKHEPIEEIPNNKGVLRLEDKG